MIQIKFHLCRPTGIVSNGKLTGKNKGKKFMRSFLKLLNEKKNCLYVR